MRDSDSGLEKMAVGHHLHDRAHVIQKSKNNRTGDEEVNQEFINMNESKLSKKITSSLIKLKIAAVLVEFDEYFCRNIS